LIVTVPSGPRSRFELHIGHRRHYGAAELRDLIDRSGWRVERVRCAGFPFFNAYKLVSIARGDAVIRDAAPSGPAGAVARHAMNAALATFDALFRWNANDTSWGWQLIATARARES
jgi:hypothetical protein